MLQHDSASPCLLHNCHCTSLLTTPLAPHSRSELLRHSGSTTATAGDTFILLWARTLSHLPKQPTAFLPHLRKTGPTQPAHVAAIHRWLCK